MVSNAAGTASTSSGVPIEMLSIGRSYLSDEGAPRPSVFGRFRRFINCTDLPETLMTVGKQTAVVGLGMIVAGLAVPIYPLSVAGAAVTLVGGAMYLTGRVIQAIRNKNSAPRAPVENIIVESVISMTEGVSNNPEAPNSPNPSDPPNPLDSPNPPDPPNEPSTANTPHAEDIQELNNSDEPSTSGAANALKPDKKIKLPKPPKPKKQKTKLKNVSPAPKPNIQLEKIKAPAEATPQQQFGPLISLMSSHPQMLQQQGIFRVSPSANVTNSITIDLLLSSFDELVTKHGPDEMANVLASRIKSCCNHCFTEEEKRDFSVRNQQMTEGNDEGITPLAEMPELYRLLIELLAKTVTLESDNKMTGKALEVVLGPNIYDPSDQNEKMQMQMQKQKPGAPKPVLFKMIQMDIETQSEKNRHQ